MKNLKKVLSLALALVMAMSLMTTAFAGDFGDADEISKTEAVEVMAAAGIIEGMPNGDFDPDGTLNRAQAAKIIAYVLEGKDEADKMTAAIAPFADVAANHWAAGAIAYCADEGIIEGVGNGKFAPNATLTGAQFAKMLLVALGFDATEYGMTGKGFEIPTAKLYIAEDLDVNLDIKLSENLSREDAAQMALNAMKWTDAETLWETTKNGQTYSFDNLKDAMMYAALIQGTVPVEVKDYSDTLLASVHKITCTGTPDSFGRPATTYAHADWDANLVYTETPDFTFNTAMTEKEIFKAVGAAGIQGASDKYIVMDSIVLNGVPSASASQIGNTDQYQASANGGINETVIVAKNDSSNAAGFGNGVVVELYKGDDANHYTMVAISEYVGTITGEIKADADKGIDRAVTIAGVGSFETENFEKGDVVLYTVDKNGIASMTAPTAIEGKVTKISNGDTYTINGNTYVLSQNNNSVSLSIGDSGSWYVDSCGNIIDVKTADDATYYYGYLLAYANKTADDADLFGENANVNGEKVKFVDSTGAIVVLDTAYTVDKDNNPTFVAPNGWNTDTKNILFRYELNSKGEISSIYAATSLPNAANITVTKGAATMSGSGVALTKDTVFFYVDLTQGDEAYAAYTGYANVPTKTGTVAARFYDTTMQAVVLVVDDVDAVSDKQYVYFGGTDVDVESTEDGDVYTYTNVYVDGVKTTLMSDGALSFTAGHIYEYTTDGDGYTTLGTDVVNTEANGTEITLIQDTYFKAGSNIYVDADTVYYEVDQTNNTISVVNGLTALSDKDAYSVNWLYNDKGTASDAAADLVVFYVGD